MLEEYIDCLFMILYFCNINAVLLNENFESPEKTDLIGAFLKLYDAHERQDAQRRKELR